jgi:SAM-dependent methyltransferase
MMKRSRISSPDAGALQRILGARELVAPDAEEMKAWHDRYTASHAPRLSVDFQIVSRFSSKISRVLEVGSVPLVLTAALSQAGVDVTGCDLAPERYSRAIARHNLDVKKCDIEREALPFPDGSFDVIVFNEIFEHLRIDLIFTMTEIWRVLRNEGVLLLSTPNLRSMKGIYNFLARNLAYSCSPSIYDEYKKLSSIGHMGHVREYTTAEVSAFLKAVGFDVVEEIYRGGYRGLPGALLPALPNLSPFVSFVAKKSPRGQAGF